MKQEKNTYIKNNSFLDLDIKSKGSINNIDHRVKNIFSNKKYFDTLSNYQKEVLNKIKIDLFENQNKSTKFKLSSNVIEEIKTLDDNKVLIYLFHRYRYEMYPQLNLLDSFPPYLQIEPSSICNYRCVFCFETDKSFTDKKKGHMGTMSLELFKNIIDQAFGNIEFISIASRGEPLVSKKIIEMLKYTENKFLNLKINTNASLLTEDICHAILSDTVKTVVFSADAADEELYKKLRVNGNLENVLKRIRMFNNIKLKHYPKSKIITRVSGVKVNSEQNFDQMKSFWGELVDQVAFVDYNPWENIYNSPVKNIKKPCSDLWRRMFVWWDGKVNPCDSDYKSFLSVGSFPKNSLQDLWKNKQYELIRNQHLSEKRTKVFPCKSCVLV